MRSTICALSLLILSATHAIADGPWFGGEPPLGPDDRLRHLFRPYAGVELNYLAANYVENLVDKRFNLTSYSHLNYNVNRLDAWHLQFPDDTARNVEALVWEDQFSPVVRLETVRRLTLGLMGAHVPGTRGYHFFRHRSGGKTFLIFDDSDGADEGRLLLATWGDSIEGDFSIGFRARYGQEWLDTADFDYADAREGAGTPDAARSAAYWHASPYVFERAYERGGQSARFTGRYWLSDENKPLEFGFSSADADELAISVGKAGEPMHFFWDDDAPGLLHLPDRETVYHSEEDGGVTLDAPDYNYLILHRPTTWACPGYSAALLILWSGAPTKVIAHAGHGYGQIEVVYGRDAGQAGGKVWLFPVRWLNPEEMEHLHRNAESFLATGRLTQKGFPSQQMVNGIPTGLAAGAYLLAKYKDPLAETARIEADNAVRVYLEPEDEDRTFLRSFFQVKAAAWMLKLAREIGDEDMAQRYEAWVYRLTDRLLSAEANYDGAGWYGGWTHFNNMRACWLAYDATGEKRYLEAYERAMGVYTIDEDGVYRDGEPLEAPGGFGVYAGALPMGVWGHWGLLDNVEQLINLQVPNGWHNPEIPVADLWNDAGAGPWAQDDANPDFMGYALRGFNLPTLPKRILPAGSFPIYREDGAVDVTRAPILDNPWFKPGTGDVRVIQSWNELESPEISAQDPAIPPDALEKGPWVTTLDAGPAQGAALDLTARGGHYRVEASPDGVHWTSRLDTWAEAARTRSVDLSYLVGGDAELVEARTITPPHDAHHIAAAGGAGLENGHRRTVTPEGYVIYQLDAPHLAECHLEALVANDYRIDLSADGQHWTEVLSPDQVNPPETEDQTDAAWLRTANASEFAQAGRLFVRLRSGGDLASFGGQPAFLRRLAVYASFDAPRIHVRITPAPWAAGPPARIDRLRLRTW